ncbi:RsmD family RNA methyltransferase [Actinotignum sp. GS-2025b]|uniref:RsmD family RNA methyltransferase n=1 Tax=Actinotignum sp. GS-2025b TaxID=3427275 RepID=UPI003F46AC09
MTRIVAGTAKGHILRVPSSGTRPTSEKAREAVFSRLDHRGFIADGEVLDLFAGSGALGLEAKSRGARAVVLVESEGPAVSIIRDNAARAHLDVTVVRMKAEKYLSQEPNYRFDAVFVDPPYRYTEAQITKVLEGLAPHVAADAVVVVERDSSSPEPSWPEGWELDDSRRYGTAMLWTAQRSAGAEGEETAAPGATAAASERPAAASDSPVPAKSAQ